MAAVVEELSPLPARLLRFFAKYPPQVFSASLTGRTYQGPFRPDSEQQAQSELRSPRPTQAAATTTPTSDSDVPTPQDSALGGLEASEDGLQLRRKELKQLHNPFLPIKNHRTGKWISPRFGLRVQADLVKLAKKYDVEELLPPGPKSTEYKQNRTLERGLRVKGTGEGQKVKGHKWERKSVVTVQERIKAMENMPALIREWKQRGHGRGWKKYPK